MLDNLYYNIGSKVKGIAVGIFILETIVAIFYGIIIMFTDEDLALYGFIVLFFGPVAAWLSSCILYAFGELVEKTCDNEYNTKNILKLMQENNDAEITKNVDVSNTNNTNNTNTHASNAEKIHSDSKNTTSKVDNHQKYSQYTETNKNTIVCSACNCEQPNNRKVCWNCGAKFEVNEGIPYWCGNCGNEGPYDGRCPICNSSLKKYGV